MKKNLFVFLALAAAAMLPATSHAIVVTIDDPDLTVTRLTSGYADVAYTGTISLTEGYELVSFTITPLSNESGQLLSSVFATPAFDLPGTLFTVRYDASDFGFYTYGGVSAFFGFSECQIGGGPCNNDYHNFSLNIVDAASVPEPATFTLFGAGLLAALAFRRRAAQEKRSWFSL